MGGDSFDGPCLTVNCVTNWQKLAPESGGWRGGWSGTNVGGGFGSALLVVAPVGNGTMAMTQGWQGAATARDGGDGMKRALNVDNSEMERQTVDGGWRTVDGGWTVVDGGD